MSLPETRVRQHAVTSFFGFAKGIDQDVSGVAATFGQWRNGFPVTGHQLLFRALGVEQHGEQMSARSDQPDQVEHELPRLCMRVSLIWRRSISPQVSENSTWYTTLTESIADRLPLSGYTSWPEIAQHGQHIQVVSEWTSIG